MRRVDGVAKVVVACVGGVRTGRGEDGGLRCSGGSGVDGAASSGDLSDKENVKKTRRSTGVRMSMEIGIERAHR